ncbi:hypothetical protein SAMN05661099_0038 [Daejeonella lutea]|uniref:Uncharacterized protein n=1 Tax=Daejeonella lutea TaxID=572036 RepID=A0A1T4ZXV6_9SPHI|nr:hypothetical protein SAMN05661099_0038 [Daejeonella lutea]
MKAAGFCIASQSHPQLCNLLQFSRSGFTFHLLSSIQFLLFFIIPPASNPTFLLDLPATFCPPTSDFLFHSLSIHLRSPPPFSSIPDPFSCLIPRPVIRPTLVFNFPFLFHLSMLHPIAIGSPLAPHPGFFP